MVSAREFPPRERMMIAQAVDYITGAFRDCHDTLAAETTVDQITQRVMDTWAAPPPVTVYGPTHVLHHERYFRQVYRVADEVAEDYNWTYIDTDSPPAVFLLQI